MSKLEIQSMLVLATSHVTDSTRRALERAPDEDGFAITSPFSVMKWPYGWLVWVDVDAADDERFPEMLAIMRLARDNGCQWIRFDCDVEPIAELPTHEWPEEPEDRWSDDSVQFPRLLAEIMATQDHLNLESLALAMDLDVADVCALFDRADRAWERAKASNDGETDESRAMALAICGVEPALTSNVRVELRAPKMGERGWWVSAWNDADAALAECRREGAIDDEGPPGWEAECDYAFVDDREGMRPVTLVVTP